MSISSFNHETAVQAIVAAHRENLGLDIDHSAAPEAPPPVTQASPVYRAANEAALRLGFIQADAHCIAQAWQAMAQRTGAFNPTQWPSAPEDFGLKPRPRANAFTPCPKQLGLYAVLPDASWVRRMALAGVPTIQLRYKSENPADIEREVEAAVKAVEGTAALLFINDHWQAAIAAGAYGVHLGQEDMHDADLDRIRDADLRLGLSTHGYAEMLRAEAVSPSYIAMGAVFPTTLKRMQTASQGLGRLRAYAKLLSDFSLVAIGGIDAERLPDVAASGVGSVAVVRAIVGAADPEREAQALQKRLRSLVKGTI